ncbi:magnesium transporter CorA [Methylobacterium terrae]|uniref:Magnesium transporter CorA n=2 Tax=Methylobacterium terrae TaxID=2202827 RepID=A0A2U8WUM8_9HYPH|nr:magnesium transporter CorA [Methylobacterium terrae]
MRFDASGRGRMVGPGEEIPALGRFGEGFVWLHVNLNDARMPGLVAEGRLGPPDLAAAAFSSDPHQRVTIEDGQIGGVIADLARDSEAPERLPDAAGRLHFVLGPNVLVSGRRHPIVGPDAVREAVAEGRALAGPVALLETLIGRVAAAIGARGAALSERLDGIEDHILDERIRDETRQLGPIRRDAVRLHRQLNGLRAVFHRLEEDGEDLAEETREAAARIAQRLDALDRDMVVLAERSRLLQEELSALLARQSNRQLQTLSVLTALFLPPTLVTGLFGMNTKGLPLAEWDDGSSVAMLIAALSAAAAFLLIRRLGLGGQKG